MYLSQLLLTSFLLAISSVNAQNSEWANSMGSSEFDLGNAITIDDLGNSYTTGQFRQTVDFDPGAGISEMTSAGLHDAYIRKLDSDGNFIWAKSLRGSNFLSGHSIAVDASENVYVVGHFFNTVDFDPGPGIFNLTSAGNEDAFVLKLDPSGNFLWAERFGSTDDDVARSIVIDNDNNLCITGFYILTVDFDPGIGIATHTSVGTSIYSDVFVLKLNASGEYIWSKSMGGPDSDMSYGIATDDVNNLYVTGHFRDVADFDPGIGVFSSTAMGQYDIFIVKLDVSGNFLWMKSIGSADNDEGYAIVAEGPQGVAITGYFSGTADFDPGVSVYNLTSNGGQDIFVLKLDGGGNFLWANAMGSTGNDVATSIAADGIGSLYLTGQYWNTADLDAGPGVLEFTSNGEGDIFIQKLSNIGAMQWTVSEGGSGDEAGKGIAMYGTSFVHLIGGFKNTVDFDVDASIYELTSVGSYDIFEQKLGTATDGASLNDLTKSAFVNMYPNPTAGKLTIEVLGDVIEVASIHLLDINGRILNEMTFNGTAVELNLSNYENGVYFVEIVSQNTQIDNRRIVVLH
jgi:hypothetical protein